MSVILSTPQPTVAVPRRARRALAAPADGQASRATATTRCLRRVDRRNERAPDVSRLAPPYMTTAPSAPASGCRRAARCPLAPCTSLMMCVDHKESRADNLTRTNCISSSSSSTRRGRTSGRMAAAFEAAPWTVHTLSATDYATVVAFSSTARLFGTTQRRLPMPDNEEAVTSTHVRGFYELTRMCTQEPRSWMYVQCCAADHYNGIINCAGLGPVQMTASAAATRGSCRCGCGRSCDRHRCRRYDLVPSPLNPPRTLYARR